MLARKDGFAAASALEVGDLVVLARGAPSPRVKPGMWSTASLAEAWFARVTTPLYESEKPVWNDKPYPHRIDLEQIAVRKNVTAAELGVEGLEYLRLSGNKQGAPLVGWQDLAVEDQEESEDPGAPPNALATTVVRLEQAKLRKSKFGDLTHVTCDLCGRLFPLRFVRAAHIKRRSRLEPGEYLVLANIMAACTFGCDELFEHGYVYVDQSGQILHSAQIEPGSSIENFFKEHLAERRCGAFSTASSKFFEFHRNVAAEHLHPALVRAEPFDLDAYRRALNGLGRGTPGRAEPSHTTYQIKVSLAYSDPLIWRRLSLPGDIPLDALHWVIQAAFGWENDHLHEFEAKGRRYADHGYRAVPGTEDERRATLAAVAPRKGDRLRYTYDFGDNWVHDIAVEAVEPAEAEPRVVCLAAENAGPPEDCGGIPGYYNLLEAVADPRHPEHDHDVDWLGDEPLDPTAVDRDAINNALGTIKVR